jgi:pyrroline-5-carboxylate reductase
MKYGFIGCGNMGGALARALALATTDFAITDRSGRAAALAEELSCSYLSAAEIAGDCPRIFLGVKPHLMREVLAPLQPVLKKQKPLLITMAAGLTMEQIQEFAGCELPVIRIMPNTPVSVGKGVILYCVNELVSPEDLNEFLMDMRFAGVMDPLEEKLIDAGSAISGSGPAFVYMFIEALADGAVTCGIPRAKAMEYAAATVIGAGELVLASGQHPGALKDAVCSPMGSTISGIRVLENHGFRAAAMEAVIATYNRNKELGK